MDFKDRFKGRTYQMKKDGIDAMMRDAKTPIDKDICTFKVEEVQQHNEEIKKEINEQERIRQEEQLRKEQKSSQENLGKKRQKFFIKKTTLNKLKSATTQEQQSLPSTSNTSKQESPLSDQDIQKQEDILKKMKEIKQQQEDEKNQQQKESIIQKNIKNIKSLTQNQKRQAQNLLNAKLNKGRSLPNSSKKVIKTDVDDEIREPGVEYNEEMAKRQPIFPKISTPMSAKTTLQSPQFFQKQFSMQNIRIEDEEFDNNNNNNNNNNHPKSMKDLLKRQQSYQQYGLGAQQEQQQDIQMQRKKSLPLNIFNKNNSAVYSSNNNNNFNSSRNIFQGVLSHDNTQYRNQIQKFKQYHEGGVNSFDGMYSQRQNLYTSPAPHVNKPVFSYLGNNILKTNNNNSNQINSFTEYNQQQQQQQQQQSNSLNYYGKQINQSNVYQNNQNFLQIPIGYILPMNENNNNTSNNNTEGPSPSSRYDNMINQQQSDLQSQNPYYQFQAQQRKILQNEQQLEGQHSKWVNLSHRAQNNYNENSNSLFRQGSYHVPKVQQQQQQQY